MPPLLATPLAPYTPKRRKRGGADLSPWEGAFGNVNEYEILLMLDPELAEERSEEILARVRELVTTSGGTLDGYEPWGRRKLLYEINHKGEGVYHLLLFSVAPATLAEISRVLKITDGVMRHLAVKRVKGGQTKAPAAVGAVAATADDSDGTAE